MGSRTIKKRITKIGYIVYLIVLMLFATSCGKSQEEVPKKQIQVEKKQVEEKQVADIPKHLLPGAEEEQEGNRKAANQAEVSEVEEANEVQEVAKKTGTPGQKSDSGHQSGTQGKDSEEKDTQEKEEPPKAEQARPISVTFAVESKNAESYGYAVYHSSVLTLDKGASVYDALASSGLRYAGDSYISGIEGLYEADCGQGSGWIYLVNGVRPNTGCQKYILADGDTIQWSYVLSP